MPYYDSASQRIKYKGRPVLLLKAEKGIGESDFSILPISSISHKENIDEIFDIEVTAEMYPLLTCREQEIPHLYRWWMNCDKHGIYLYVTLRYNVISLK